MKRFFASALVLTFFFSPFSASAVVETVPEVGKLSPTSAVWNVPTLFSGEASDESVGLSECRFVVNSTHEFPMTYNSTTSKWEYTHTFSDDRTANSIRMKCTNASAVETVGKGVIVSVSEVAIQLTDGEGSGDDLPDEVDATTWDHNQLVAVSPVLIKLQCPGGEDVTHPCRTVYFLDNVGKRHAFPNEKTFFTWYDDFTNIHVVSSSVMSSFTLGKNVTYHPAKRMVKFPSVPTVYAVGRYGVLNPVPSEQIAKDLYGNDWQSDIDDISEAFFGSYTVAIDPIMDASVFDINTQLQSVSSINDNMTETSQQ